MISQQLNTKDGTLYRHLTADEIDKLWGPIDPITISAECQAVGNANPVGSRWGFVLENLKPGSYEVTTTIVLEHTVIDGFDCDDDGQVDLLRPEDLSRTTVNIIKVIG